MFSGDLWGSPLIKKKKKEPRIPPGDRDLTYLHAALHFSAFFLGGGFYAHAVDACEIFRGFCVGG